MGKSDAPFFLVPLLALVALIYPMALNQRTSSAPAELTNPAARPANTRQAEANSSASELARNRAAVLVEEYLDAQPGAPGWVKNDPRAGYKIEFIIATVPDPIDSNLPFFFDAFLDSIQRASESAGYVLDRFDIAWKPQRGSKPEEKQSAPQRPAEYEREPGILLFRNPSARKLLVVFLVGETATSGIHPLAMASALQQIAGFYPWGPGHSEMPVTLPQPAASGPAPAINVMGPSFSGSASSLQFALESALEQWSKLPGAPQVQFRIISGSATAITPEDFARLGDGKQVSFHAVVPPDAGVMQQLIEFLQSFGQQRIAILSEGNTAYGQQVRKAATKAFPTVLTLPFPLHISQLRTASAKAQSSKPQTATEVGTPPPSESLPLPEENSSTAKDTPPFFSSLEVTSAQLVLSNLLAALSREDIHAVGILATDVRDTIFLTQEIRKSCPATLLFTISSDLLYTHPDANSSTQGMLFAAPYPLFDLNQLWTVPFAGGKTRLQFPNEAAEGVYNAMLALLGDESSMLEYGPPFSRPAEGRPALWVMVVGRQGPLPVKVLNWSDRDDYTLAVKRAPIARTHSGAKRRPTARGVYTPETVFAVVALSLFFAALSVLLIRQYMPLKWLKHPGRHDWFGGVAGDLVSPQYCPQSRLFLYASSMAWLSFYVLLLVAFSLPGIASLRLGLRMGFPGWPSVAIGILGLCLLAQVGATAALGYAAWKAPAQQTRFPREVKSIIVGGSAGGLILAVFLAGSWIRTVWQSPSQGIFIYLRAYDLASGLSPLVPLLCVALAALLWGVCSYRRLRLVDGMQPLGTGSPNVRFRSLLKFSTKSFAGVTELERDVRDLLEGPSIMSAGWYVALLCVALIAGSYFFFFRFVRSFENGAFFVLFGAAFFVVYWGLAMEFARLWLLWRRFSQLLRRLSWHPTRAAYGRYRKTCQGLFRVDFAIPPPTYTILEFSVDQAVDLLDSANTLAGSALLSDSAKQELNKLINDGGPEVARAGQKLADAFGADAAGDWRLSLTRRSEAQSALARLTGYLACMLEPNWRMSSGGATLDESIPQVKSLIEMGEEFLVGRVVLFISYVLPSLRNLGAFTLAGLLLMLFAVMAYPFQPRNQFLLFNWVVILCFVGAALVILLQVERDVVLNLLNNTSPGQVTVTRQFVFRIFTYVLLPVLALLSAQFPSTVGQLASLIGLASGHR